MRAAIMQPYFWPYIGYFQLINCADIFVIYDDIEYTKKGWINRNRILSNGQSKYVTLPLKHGSDYLDIKERFLSDNFHEETRRILRRIKGAYLGAPHYSRIIKLAESCLFTNHSNLFEFLFNSVVVLNSSLSIDTQLIISSTLNIGRKLRGQERVLATCKALGATEYINLPGGHGLYSNQAFKKRGIQLIFLEPRIGSYPQSHNIEFVENLSIIDILMWLGIEGTKRKLEIYKLHS